MTENIQSQQTPLQIFKKKQQQRNKKYKQILKMSNQSAIPSRFQYTLKSQQHTDRLKDLLNNIQAQIMSLQQNVNDEEAMMQCSPDQNMEAQKDSKITNIDLCQLRCKLQSAKIKKYKLKKQKIQMQQSERTLQQDYEHILGQVKQLEEEMKQKRTGFTNNESLAGRSTLKKDQYMVFKQYLQHHVDYNDENVDILRKNVEQGQEDISISAIKLANILSYQVMKSERQISYFQKKIKNDLPQTDCRFTEDHQESPQTVSQQVIRLREQLAAKKKREGELAQMTTNLFQQSIEYKQIDEQVNSKISRYLQKEDGQINRLLGGIKKMVKMIQAVGDEGEIERMKFIMRQNQINVIV